MRASLSPSGKLAKMSIEPRKVMIVIGTRPEMIKLAPVILEIKRRANGTLSPVIVFTGQHEELVQQAAEVFDISPDFNLHEMHKDDNLTKLTSRLLIDMGEVLEKSRPDMVIVQGDTTSAFAAGLAAFYQHIPVAHVEAGLRTKDIYSPFPEEANRALLSRLATIHFAPTSFACDNLMSEGLPRSQIVVTGNTVIDAINLVKGVGPDAALLQKALPSKKGERLILMTMHRRETWDTGIARACDAVRTIVKENPDIRIAFPVHPGPVVHNRVFAELDNVERVDLLPPLDYTTFIGLAARSQLLLTDSGGLQEEGAALHKPVIILRETTERYEALDAGGARLVGTDPDKIIRSVVGILNSPDIYQQMSKAPNPFGDGHAARRIIDSLEAWFSTGSPALSEAHEFAKPEPSRKISSKKISARKRHVA